MSSRLISSAANLHRTTGFRLALAYTVLFTGSSLIVLGLAYYSLSVSLARRDAEAIHEKFADLEINALTSSLDQLRDEALFEKKRGRRGPFFVRVMARRGGSVFYEQGQIDWSRTRLAPESSSGDALISVPGDGDKPPLDFISKAISPTLILQVGKSAEGREDTLRRFAEIVAASAVIVVLAGVAGGAHMARRALHPVRHLISAVQEAERGALGTRVPIRGTGDELDRLGVLFNGMLVKIEALIGGMRNALDNVAHDLRTPMTRLRASAEASLETGRTPADFREALADCLEESSMALEMLKTLMDISEAETGAMRLELEAIDLSQLMRESAEIYRYAAEKKGVSLRTEGLNVFLACDRNRMRQVLGNLLDNAVKYTPSGGAVSLKAFRQAGSAVFAVSDTGCGIPPEDLPKIWDRLYRGDSSRSQRGLGLGLSLVKAIVAAHKGRIEVESRPGEGSRFTAFFPA